MSLTDDEGAEVIDLTGREPKISMAVDFEPVSSAAPRMIPKRTVRDREESDDELEITENNTHPTKFIRTDTEPSIANPAATAVKITNLDPPIAFTPIPVAPPPAPPTPVVVQDNSNERDILAAIKGVKEILPLCPADFIRKTIAELDGRCEIGVLIDRLMEKGFPEETVPPPAPSPSSKPAVSKTAEEYQIALLDVLTDLDPAYALTIIKQQLPLGLEIDVVNRSVAFILEQKSYPRASKKSQAKPVFTNPNVNKDYFQDSSPISDEDTYAEQALQVLKSEFATINVPDIRRIFHEKKRRYAPSWHAITEQLTQPKSTLKRVQKRKAHSLKSIHAHLQNELEFIRKYKLTLPVEAAQTVGEKVDESEAIECQCCFDTFKFEGMVQCDEGHLFCSTCLKRYTEQAIFDAGGMELTCMAQDCKASFSRNQLEKVLTINVLIKLDERRAEKDLENVEGLVKCPFCSYAEIFENPNDSVLVCKNPDCAKESCRWCQEENHIPKRCAEVEKASDTKKRLTVEERMTEARIRTCHKCKAKFFKTEGCNKMTCRCGALMCYVCRAAIPASIGYQHFCQHVHVPGKGCETCKKCVLFTNAEQDDLMAVEEARKAAGAEVQADNLVPSVLTPTTPVAPTPMPAAPLGLGFPIGIGMALPIPNPFANADNLIFVRNNRRRRRR